MCSHLFNRYIRVFGLLALLSVCYLGCPAEPGYGENGIEQSSDSGTETSTREPTYDATPEKRTESAKETPPKPPDNTPPEASLEPPSDGTRDAGQRESARERIALQEQQPPDIPPPAPSASLAVSAGSANTCALTSCGQVRCWGLGIRLGDPKATQHNAPAGKLVDLGTGRRAIQLISGSSWNCALLDNNALRCWGPTPPATITFPGRQIKQFAVSSHICAVLDDGSVRCWGSNLHGQLGYGDKRQRNTPDDIPIALGSGRTAKEVAVGTYHTCVRLADEQVICWGRNNRFQLGVLGSADRTKPPTNTLDLGAQRTAKKIYAAGNFSCALLNNGAFKCWGENLDGQLGRGTTSIGFALPLGEIQLKQTAKQAALGNSHVCAQLDDDTLRCWGRNVTGQLGYGNRNKLPKPSDNPVNIGIGRKAIQLAMGNSHSCALLDDGTTKCWGGNHNGQLGYGDLIQRTSPPKESIFVGQARCGGTCTDLLYNKNDCGSCGRTCPGSQVCTLGVCHLPLKSIEAGGFLSGGHVCSVRSDGQVQCWGENADGELGYGDKRERLRPSSRVIPLPIGRKATSVVIHASSGVPPYGVITYVLLDDKTAVRWARNEPLSQVNVGAGRTIEQIAVASHTCALLDKGQIICWGVNRNGQLGYGDTKTRNTPTTPINLGTGRTATYIANGSFHSCAILENGEVKCWGWNANGQLGYGDKTNRSAPPQTSIDLGAGRRAITLALSSRSSCALLDDETVKCWGDRTGLNTPRNSTAPRQRIDFGLGRRVKQLTAGSKHFCVLLDNGSVKCWGDNFDKQLGYPGVRRLDAPTSKPVDLGAGQRATFVNAGSQTTCVILENGRGKCWGDNRDGQLGYGDKRPRQQPETHPIPTR